MALAVLAIGLAPWCMRLSGILHNLGTLTLLLGIYLVWYVSAGYVLGASPSPSALQQYLALIAILMFLILYLIQALILARPLRPIPNLFTMLPIDSCPLLPLIGN